MERPNAVRTGAVMDFRGPPVVPLGVLCNNAADMMGVQATLNLEKLTMCRSCCKIM